MAPLSYMNVASNYSKVDHATTSNNYITNDVPTEQQFKNIPEIPLCLKKVTEDIQASANTLATNDIKCKDAHIINWNKCMQLVKAIHRHIN